MCKKDERESDAVDVLSGCEAVNCTSSSATHRGSCLTCSQSEILPKLDATATLNLAQVNKWYNERGVERGWRSIDRGEDETW